MLCKLARKVYAYLSSAPVVSRDSKLSSQFDPEKNVLPIVQNRLEIDGVRLEILDALKEKHQDLSNIYTSGVLVFNAEHIPNRLHLSAHCIREVMEKLERHLVVIEQGEKSLKPLAITLQEYWDKKISREMLTADLPWQVNVQGDVLSFLIRCEDFFSKSNIILMKKSETAHAVVKELMKQSGVNQLPSAIAENKVESWIKCRKYFIATAHHKATNLDEFQTYLCALEILLHGLLMPPRTFDNMQKILEIIAQGEGHGN